MRGLAVLILLSLAGCATTRASAGSDWLVGTWLMMDYDAVEQFTRDMSV